MRSTLSGSGAATGARERARAATEAMRRACASFDALAMALSADDLAELARASASREISARAEMARRWCDAFAGAPVPARAVDGACEETGAEALACAALVHAAGGAHEEALGAAREAHARSAASRSASLVALTGIALGRARRLAGEVPKATRILTSLAASVAPAWLDWIAWEALLAGAAGSPRSAALVAAPEAGCSSALRALVTAIDTGAHGAVLAHADDVRARTSGCAWLVGDLDVLLAVAGVESGRALPTLEQWASGRTSEVPRQIRCLFRRAGDAEASMRAWVVAEPGRPGRRVLELATALRSEHARIERPRGQPGRIESLVAALCLAGPDGLPVGRAFRETYGLAYVPAFHRPTFDVLLHRARARLRGLATLERDARSVRLALERPLFVEDPRTGRSLERPVLEEIARRWRASSAEISEALGVPARTLRRVLTGLVEDGACRRERAGIEVQYWVEDSVAPSGARE